MWGTKNSQKRKHVKIDFERSEKGAVDVRGVLHAVVQREWPIRCHQLALFIVLCSRHSYWLAATLHRSYWLDMICVLAQWALACNPLTRASG